MAQPPPRAPVVPPISKTEELVLTGTVAVVLSFDPAVTALLQAGLTALNTLSAQITALQEQVKTMSDSITAELANLQSTVASEITVENSAVALINGIPALISAAVAAAGAAGATPDQLAAFGTLNTQIQASSTALAAAVTANTPAAPAAPAAPATP